MLLLYYNGEAVMLNKMYKKKKKKKKKTDRKRTLHINLLKKKIKGKNALFSISLKNFCFIATCKINMNYPKE